MGKKSSKCCKKYKKGKACKACPRKSNGEGGICGADSIDSRVPSAGVFFSFRGAAPMTMSRALSPLRR